MSKTSIKQKDEFIKLRDEGKTYQEIADMYGVSRQCIYQVIHRDKMNKNRREYNKKYYRENKEKCRALVKKWHELHPNYQAAYYRTHIKNKKSIDKE